MTRYMKEVSQIESNDFVRGKYGLYKREGKESGERPGNMWFTISRATEEGSMYGAE